MCSLVSFEQNGDGLDIGLGLNNKNKKQIIKSKIVHKILIRNIFLVRLLELQSSISLQTSLVAEDDCL